MFLFTAIYSILDYKLKIQSQFRLCLGLIKMIKISLMNQYRPHSKWKFLQNGVYKQAKGSEMKLQTVVFRESTVHPVYRVTITLYFTSKRNRCVQGEKNEREARKCFWKNSRVGFEKLTLIFATKKKRCHATRKCHTAMLIKRVQQKTDNQSSEHTSRKHLRWKKEKLICHCFERSAEKYNSVNGTLLNRLSVYI